MAVDLRYLKASDGTGSAVLAHVTNPRLTGATTLKVDNVDNWPPFFIATSGTLAPNGYIAEATKCEFRGHLSGADIVIDGFEPGFTDSGNTTQHVVIIKQTTGWSNGVTEAMQVAHNQDGTLKDKIATLPKINGGTTAGVLTTDASGNVTVGAKTVDANGWTVYNYGGWKEYEIWFDIGSGGDYDTAAISLPVGVPNMGNVFAEVGTNMTGTWSAGAYSHVFTMHTDGVAPGSATFFKLHRWVASGVTATGSRVYVRLKTR